jgi:D-tagatose-1,6-bisphosphate aldolase subunit GatZ/KbaZ
MPAAGTTERFAPVLEENRRGSAVSICSICLANRFVLEAGILQAQHDDNLVLIESTFNPVNQFGGYTCQTPAQFA